MLFSALKMFSTRRMYTFVQVLLNIFQWRIFTSLRVDQNVVSNTWKCYLQEEYTPLCVFLKNVLMKNIYLCESVLKCYFLHLKISLPEEHTPLWKCLFKEFSRMCELIEIAFSTLEKVFYWKNLHLSVSVFHIFQWRIYTPVQVD